MKRMYSIVFSTALFLHACEEEPYVKHEMAVEKMGPCNKDVSSVKMESNINGERYVFEECLPENFDGKSYSVLRKGDSLFVSFPQAQQTKTALFKLTLDVTANPVYKCIKLGDRTPINIKTITKF